MLWVIYSFLSAFFWATSDAFTKKNNKKIDDYIIILSRFLYSLPFVIIILFFISIPKLDLSFWIFLAIMIPFEVLAWIMYLKSVTHAPLSLVMPFLSLTPVFLLLTSFLILGELPTLVGLIGILLVVMGAYVMNFNRNSFIEPFKEIFNNKGIVLMIIAAFLFSITSNLAKILILKSSPLFFFVMLSPATVIPLFVLAYIKAKRKMKQLNTNFKNFFLVGFFFSLSQIFTLMALELIIVPYMSSIKRTSGIFGIFYGKFIFKEKGIKQRLLGAAIMLTGAALIILF